jgi:hypothetical protein
MLPSSIEGKPILLRISVEYWAAKSFNLTVKFPIKTKGRGVIVKRNHIGNTSLLATSLPNINNTSPYNTKTKEKPERK